MNGPGPATHAASSLAECLAIVARKIPPALISAEAAESITEVAAGIPGESTTFFGFEARLGTPDPSADFLVCLKPEPEQGRALLADGDSWPFTASSPAGQRVQSFAKEWADPASELHDRTENVWLEFDLAGQAAVTAPTPSVFFGCHDQVRADAPERDKRWITGRALPILQDAAYSVEVGRRITAAINALPPGAFVFQIGAMLSRSTNAVRLCVRGISGRQILDYLAAIGWPGSLQELAEPFSEIAPLADRIDLDFDISEDGVLPKIGLEWYLYQHLRVDPRWDVFLKWLVDRGLGTPEKSRALYDYPGAQQERSKDLVWPQYLRQASAASGPNFLSTLVRAVHHIKVVHHPGGAMEAKAYLAVCHNLLDIRPFISGQLPAMPVQLAPIPQFSGRV